MEHYIESIMLFSLVTTILLQLIPQGENKKLVGAFVGLFTLLVFVEPFVANGALLQDIKAQCQESLDSEPLWGEKSGFDRMLVEQQCQWLLSSLCPECENEVTITYDKSDAMQTNKQMKSEPLFDSHKAGVRQISIVLHTKNDCQGNKPNTVDEAYITKAVADYFSLDQSKIQIKVCSR